MHLSGFLKDFVITHPFTVALNMSFSLLTPVQDVVLPHFYGKLIDAISNHGELRKNIFYVLSIFVMLEIGFILSDWHDVSTISGFQTFTRQQILKNIMSKYEHNFADLNIGNILSKVVKIPYTLVVCYERVKYTIIPYIIVFSTATMYFAHYDTILGVSLFVTALVFAGVVLSVPSYVCKNFATEKDKMVNDIHEEIDDTLRNFIAMHGDAEKQRTELERLAKYEELFTVKFAQAMKCLMKTKAYTSVIFIAFTTVFILRSYHLLLNKKLTTASFSSMFLILVYLTNSLMHIDGQLREIIFDWGVLTEADDLFNKYDDIDKPNSTRHNTARSEIPQSEGIGMSHVSFAFPNSNEDTLKDITFNVKKGEKVVLLGDIGTGKSTILKLLLKFNEPKTGTIYLNGVAYNDMDTKELKRKVGYMPQQPLLFNRSVIENITYGVNGVTRKDVEALIKKIGVEGEFTNLEDGLDTKIGKNGSRLSGGQRQVVWCLRTIVQNPDIVIMDEPTASLDDKGRSTLIMILDVIMKDKTVIIVTHDKGLLDMADRRLFVKNGMIEENEKSSVRQGWMMPQGGLLDK
jgi:ABC-type multidrug transport system fused ATPase/permease subunit